MQAAAGIENRSPGHRSAMVGSFSVLDIGRSDERRGDLFPWMALARPEYPSVPPPQRAERRGTSRAP